MKTIQGKLFGDLENRCVSESDNSRSNGYVPGSLKDTRQNSSLKASASQKSNVLILKTTRVIDQNAQ